MEKFLLSEQYRLELHWERAIYNVDGVCELKGAYLSGPALNNAEKINPNDYIMLDFYKQYVILVKHVYVVKLSWEDVVYNKNNTITLKKAIISHDTELNNVPQFKSTDYVVIDTSKHEASTHMYYMFYDSYVVNEDCNLYNFTSK